MTLDLAPFRRRKERALVYGHRGARARAPENTLEAFDLALREGADGVEFDVRMSGDGELVIHHDALLSLGNGRFAELSQLSLAQLRRLSSRTSAPMPTLDDVLDWHAEHPCLLNVELKGDVPNRAWLARQAARAIRARGASGLLISSFYPELVFRSARLLPDVPVALLLEPQGPGRHASFAVRYPWFGAVGVHPERRMLSAAYFRALAHTGAIVNTWTVNDPSEAIALSELGVDGIVTDRPLEILAALRGPGQHS